MTRLEMIRMDVWMSKLIVENLIFQMHFSCFKLCFILCFMYYIIYYIMYYINLLYFRIFPRQEVYPWNDDWRY